MPRPSLLDILRWQLAKLIAGQQIRREVRKAFEDGCAMGHHQGMQEHRDATRGPDATPEPHDACTTDDAVALTAANPVRDILR